MGGGAAVGGGPVGGGAVGGGGNVGAGGPQTTAKLTVTELFDATYAGQTARLLMLQATRLSWEMCTE